MSQQHAFNLNWRNPLPARFEAIVAASHVIPVTIAIAAIEISRANPATDKGLGRRFGILPIAASGTVALDPQIAFGACGRRFSFFIQEPSFVTVEYLAAAAVA